MWDTLADERLAFFVSAPKPAVATSRNHSFVNAELPEAFWAEMSACEHFVQIYETDDTFLDTLSGFVGGGLKTGDAAIVIATPEHRDALDSRLVLMGIDVASAKSNNLFVSLDAQETLDQFMREGWPDEQKFADVVRGILCSAGAESRKVRAFGEMVALLWAQGFCAATVRLEHLWQQLCQRESFALFCAYPKSGFTEYPSDSIARICAAHSRAFAN
jgi:hypothetical protein